MKKFLVALGVFACLLVSAEGDHNAKETITGSGFDLVHVNSILVGTYNIIPIWAEKICGSHIRGKVKVGEETLDFSVEMIDKKITGMFKDLKVQFAKMDIANKKIILKAGEELVEINFTTQGYDAEEGHNFGITFNFNSKGEEHSIFLDGESCYGSMIFYSIFFYGITSL